MQWTVREVARLLNVPEKTVFRLVDEAGLPAHLVNDQHRFHRSEVLDWATARGEDVAPEMLGAVEADEGPVAGLADALRRGGIHYGLVATDRSSALRAALDCMPLPAGTDPEFLWQVLLAREGQGSSSVGQGVAIPHIRNPIVLRVRSPQVSISFLERGVDFGAKDGIPVDTLFTLVSPTVRSHLHVLSRIAHTIRDATCHDLMVRRAPAEVILAAIERLEHGGAA